MALCVITEPEKRDHAPAGVCYIDTVDYSVVLDGRGHGGLPVDTSTAGGHDSKEMSVFELDEEAGSLAKVAPNCVPNDLHIVPTSCFECGRLGFELEEEAVLVVDRLLADTGRG